jgi:hypothetical protein
MHAELASLVGCGSDHSTFVALTSDDDGLVFESGVEQLFHGHEEGVHIDVKDSFDLIRQRSSNAGAIVRQSRGERQ